MITIVDYEAGNLTSVYRALKHLGVDAKISADPEEIKSAEKIIFPGVGHAESAMKSLKSRGLDEALKVAFNKGTPIMGICLGTQIILSHSEEGDVDTLDIIEGECKKFNLEDKSLAVPHMGWNEVLVKGNHPILRDLKDGDELYFVHSYYTVPTDESVVVATCEYEINFACALSYKNLFATQFHPEKSGPVGLQIFKNFSEWDGSNG
jgi:glutamine amidotransferase